MPFRIDENPTARDISLVELTGEIDSRGVRELNRRLFPKYGRRAMVVDLTGVRLIDPRVLGWLVTTANRLRPRGGRLAVVCPDPVKRQIFGVVGLDRVFPVAASLDAALCELESTDADTLG